MKKLTACLVLALLTGVVKAQNIKPIVFEKLQERFEKGKDTTYIVNFWATWCAPCVKEMPYFEQLQAKYQDKPLKVIFLSLDFRSQLESKVKPLIGKMNLKSEVYLADKKSEQEFINQVSREWEGAIPATLVVNAGKAVRNFYPKEFTFDTLEKTYQSLK